MDASLGLQSHPTSFNGFPQTQIDGPPVNDWTPTTIPLSKFPHDIDPVSSKHPKQLS